jgi:hypothetical protein
MPQSLVHLPDRNGRVLRRKLTRTEIDMLELDLAPAVDALEDSLVDMPIAPIVFAKNGSVFASSRDVATFFGKEHRNVLRDIGGLLKSEHTHDTALFVSASYVDPQNRQAA